MTFHSDTIQAGWHTVPMQAPVTLILADAIATGSNPAVRLFYLSKDAWASVCAWVCVNVSL